MRFILTLSLLTCFCIVAQPVQASIATVYHHSSTVEASSTETKSEKTVRFKKLKIALAKGLDSAKKTDGMAVASFVCGLISILVAGIPLGIAAVVFGIVAQGRIRRSDGAKKGRGLAIAGVILGVVGVVGAIIVLANRV